MSAEKKTLRKHGEAIWNFLGKITGKILHFLGLEVKVKPRFFRTFAMFILLIAFSTISIHFVEERSWFDSLYFTVSTISTVGFGDITPQSTVGKIIVILLIIFGIAIFFLIIESLMQIAVKKRVAEVLKLEEEEIHLENHVIVAGFGRYGEVVAKELKTLGETVVVIDAEEEKIEEAKEDGFVAIKGSAMEEDVLIKAEIEKAKALVITQEDAGTVAFIAITAQQMNPEIRLIARASKLEYLDQFLKVGIDRVISPEAVGGRMMARAATAPQYFDFLNRLTVVPGLELAEMNIEKGSDAAGKSIGEMTKQCRAYCLVLYKESGEIVPSPPPENILEAGDHVIMFGTSEQLLKTKKYLSKPPEEEIPPLKK
ncbi:MAG: TrkA family potassium uptake protein [Asgard group archaeon]